MVSNSPWSPVTVESAPTQKITYNIPPKKTALVAADISKRFRFLKLPRVGFKDPLLAPFSPQDDSSSTNEEYDPKLDHAAFEEYDFIIAVEHCCDCEEHSR